MQTLRDLGTIILLIVLFLDALVVATKRIPHNPIRRNLCRIVPWMCFIGGLVLLFDNTILQLLVNSASIHLYDIILSLIVMEYGNLRVQIQAAREFKRGVEILAARKFKRDIQSMMPLDSTKTEDN